jgi:hypothetical protein
MIVEFHLPGAPLPARNCFVTWCKTFNVNFKLQKILHLTAPIIDLLHGTESFLRSQQLPHLVKEFLTFKKSLMFITVFTKACWWSLFWGYVTFHGRLDFTVRSCWPCIHPPSWWTTPCQLSVTDSLFCSYPPPYWEGLPPSTSRGCAVPWWHGTHSVWSLHSLLTEIYYTFPTNLSLHTCNSA